MIGPSAYYDPWYLLLGYSYTWPLSLNANTILSPTVTCLKFKSLEKISWGSWGKLCLSEPQQSTFLSSVRTANVPMSAQTWRILVFLNICSGKHWCPWLSPFNPGAQSFTSLKADLRQDINGGFTFIRFLNGTFPWRKGYVNAFVSFKSFGFM